MRIINGRLPLSIKRASGMLSVKPLTVTDNLIADYNTLRVIMISFSPDDVKIFMDASIELQLFKSVNLGPKDYLKEQFLVTDIEEGIAKVITPLKEAQAKREAEELAAKEEVANMASYKKKYEVAVKEIASLSRQGEEYAKENEAKINDLAKELDNSRSTISELRSALKVATDKIDSMKSEFNAACQKYHLSKTAEGEWKQDFEKAVPEGCIVLEESILEEMKSEVAKLTQMHSDDTTLISSLRAELKAQDEQLVKLHTEIGTICAEFNLGKDDSGKYVYLTNEIATPVESKPEDPVPAEVTE